MVLQQRPGTDRGYAKGMTFLPPVTFQVLPDSAAVGFVPATVAFRRIVGSVIR